jgi:hypothetical protein
MISPFSSRVIRSPLAVMMKAFAENLAYEKMGWKDQIEGKV